MRELLLPFTIQNAAKLPMYRHLWSGVNTDSIATIAALAALPSVTTEQFRRFLMMEPLATAQTTILSHSTGTTSRTLTWRHRTTAEAAAIKAVFSKETISTPSGLGLLLVTSRHGMEMPVPGSVTYVPGSVADDVGLIQCLEMLRTDLRFATGMHRISILAGLSKDLCLLAQAALENGCADEFEIERLYVGGYLPPDQRAVLTSVFPAAQLVEKYSLSEVFGGATRTDGSHPYRLDPYVVGEVVLEDGTSAGNSEVGELVLTELFPFVQQQPLIRYRTGDVVERVGTDASSLKFHWWGRRHDCVVWQGSWVTGYRVFSDWLAKFAIVSTCGWRADSASVTFRGVAGPCFLTSLDRDSAALVLRVGVRLNPWSHQPSLADFLVSLERNLPSLVRQTADSGLYIKLGLTYVPDSLVSRTHLYDRPYRWTEFTPVSAPRFMFADPGTPNRLCGQECEVVSVPGERHSGYSG